MQEIIQRIIDAHDLSVDGPLNTYLARELIAQQQIRTERRRQHQRQETLAKEASDLREAVKEAGWKLIAKCRHWSVTYHPDAAGGSDSCYVCDDCGFQSRTVIERGRRLD